MYRDYVNVTVLNTIDTFTSGNFYDKDIITLLTSDNNPATREEALSGPDSRKWRSSMMDQIKSLCDLNTFELIHLLPAGRKALKYKWVFKVKRDGLNKSRLTVKGCNQRPGADFHNTFSPVAKITLFRLFLAIVVQLKLYMRSFDVDSAFPNAELNEDIFMECPPELLEYLKINADIKFVKLKRALYGLKQASREWYKTLSAYLIELGFTSSLMDPCILYRIINGKYTLILLYVDDINSSNNITRYLYYYTKFQIQS
jgi:hypothetical protein